MRLLLLFVLLGILVCVGVGGVAALIAGRELAGFGPPEGTRVQRVDGVDLHLVDEGDGARSIVLIHGGGGSIDDWDALRERLVGEFRVVTVERPGNGWSRDLPAAPDDRLAANAAILNRLLSDLGVERPVLVGWSYGGAVALRMASDSPLATPGVVHLLGIAPGFSAYRSAVGPAVVAGRALLLPGLGPLLDRSLRPAVVLATPRATWMQRQYGDAWTTLPERTLERTRLGMLRSKRTAVREMVALGDDLERLSPRLAELHRPVLIISGGRDDVVPVYVGEELEELLPYGRRLLLPEAVHAFHVVEPDRAAQLIRLFVRSVR